MTLTFELAKLMESLTRTYCGYAYRYHPILWFNFDPDLHVLPPSSYPGHWRLSRTNRWIYAYLVYPSNLDCWLWNGMSIIFWIGWPWYNICEQHTIFYVICQSLVCLIRGLWRQQSVYCNSDESLLSNSDSGSNIYHYAESGKSRGLTLDFFQLPKQHSSFWNLLC